MTCRGSNAVLDNSACSCQDTGTCPHPAGGDGVRSRPEGCKAKQGGYYARLYYSSTADLIGGL